MQHDNIVDNNRNIEESGDPRKVLTRLMDYSNQVLMNDYLPLSQRMQVLHTLENNAKPLLKIDTRLLKERIKDEAFGKVENIMPMLSPKQKSIVAKNAQIEYCNEWHSLLCSMIWKYLSRWELELPEEDEDNSLVDYCKAQIKSNREVNILIVGATGRGKSWLGLRIAQLTDPKFTADYVAFKHIQFLELFKQFRQNPEFKGRAFMWDEMGVAMDNRSWYNKIQQKITHIFQTKRYVNSIGLFTVPDIDMVDAKLRKLMHVVIEVQGYDQKTGRTVCKIKYLQHNPILSKTYAKNMKLENNTYVKKSYFYKPTKKVSVPYEEMAREYKDSIFEATEKEIVNIGKKELTDKQKQVYKLKMKGMINAEIARKLDVADANITQHLKAIKVKGWLT